MDPIWLRSYPPGVPRSVDARAVGSIVDLADAAFRRDPDRTAFVHRQRSLSYGEVDRLSRGYAAFLRHTLGLEKGDRVALMCPNVLAFPVALFGNLRAGLVQVSVNPHYTPRELKHQLRDAGARTIVLVESALPALEPIVEECAIRSVVVIGPDGLDAPVRQALPGSVRRVDCRELGEAVVTPPEDEARPSVSPDDLAFLQYTGGTTGRAKGAMLTHANAVANVLCFEAFTRGVLDGTRNAVVTATPLYHILGLVVNCLTFVHRGGVNLLIEDPRNVEAFVGELQRHRFNAITGVNALYNRLLNTPGIEKVDFSDLRLAMGGGTHIEEAVDRRWHALSGVHIREGYGMSETCGLTQTPTHLEGFRSTIGLPYPNIEFSIRDPSGQEVPPGETGELCVRGDSVMRAYWGYEADRSEYMTPDGFFKTGDIGRMDAEGYLYLVDRKKDMISVSGFNVFPVEVEEVGGSMPGVLECACIGLPDPRTGEAVKLFVVPRPGVTLTVHAVRAHCRRHLVAYKVPKHVEFLDAVPRTPVGKILRRVLREREPRPPGSD